MPSACSSFSSSTFTPGLRVSPDRGWSLLGALAPSVRSTPPRQRSRDDQVLLFLIGELLAGRSPLFALSDQSIGGRAGRAQSSWENPVMVAPSVIVRSIVPPRNRAKKAHAEYTRQRL